MVSTEQRPFGLFHDDGYREGGEACYFVQVPPPELSKARKKKQRRSVVTSVQISLVVTLIIGIVCFLTQFTDLLRFPTSSRQSTLKQQLHFFVILPLILAFCS